MNRSSKSNICTIFPHIPKCSETSLKSQLEMSDLNIYFDYDKPPHNRKFFQQACETRNKEASFLDFGQFDLVFGHFPIKRYQRDNYQYITLMRDPLERAISQYYYWKNVIPETNKLALHRNPIISDIKKGKIKFTEFLKATHADSFYLNYLGNMNPEEFLLIGFTDDYARFLNGLSEIFGYKFTDKVKLRVGNKEPIKEKEIKQASEILKPDIERYDTFRNYWVNKHP